MVGYRLLRFVLRLPAMSLLLCVACQSVSVDTQGNQETLFVSVVDGVTLEPLEGVELCEFDTDNCTMTDADGLATLELPRGEDVMWSRVKEDYGSVLTADRTDATFDRQTSRGMWTDEWLADRCEELGPKCEWPPGTDGTIWILTSPPMVGVTFKLVGVTRDPYYSWRDEDTVWQSSYELSETTDTGVGGFHLVPPGEHRLRMAGTAQRCAPDSAWATEASNEVRLPVRSDYITYAWINCSPL